MRIFLLLTTILFAAFPDWFYNISNVNEKKKAFIKIMLPLIKSENNRILAQRKAVIAIFNNPFYLVDKNALKTLAIIAKEYKIKDILNKKEFLKRVDTIPISLVLAQAAIESGWGSSRFVKEANNIFGHWSFSNRGLKPLSRYEEIEYEYSIRIFPTLTHSIRAYMKNLNTNKAYEKFRENRFKHRINNKTFSGIEAAKDMQNYSQLREEYVKILQKIIKKNFYQFEKGEK